MGGGDPGTGLIYIYIYIYVPGPGTEGPHTPPNLGERSFPSSFPPPSFLSFPLSFLPCLLLSKPYQQHITTKGEEMFCNYCSQATCLSVNSCCFHIQSSTVKLCICSCDPYRVLVVNINNHHTDTPQGGGGMGGMGLGEGRRGKGGEEGGALWSCNIFFLLNALVPASRHKD